MKFGVRECCDVVFRAKAPQKIGDKIFYKDEPVIYFDTVKTSTLEGAATTVYAQGGRGNARLIAWEGDRTLTFTMEDALISPEGFAILSGAGLVTAGGNENKKIYVHATETVAIADGSNDTATVASGSVKITLSETPATVAGAAIYVMIMDANGNMISEPYSSVASNPGVSVGDDGAVTVTLDTSLNSVVTATSGHIALVDYYVEKASGAQQIEITADKFGGNFYVEASTLFRDTNGVDMPAEFVIPNAKVQSNFTFTMAGSGDPSTFTFTMDAFPDYTRFDKSKKVLAAIQIIGVGTEEVLTRDETNTARIENSQGQIVGVKE